MTLIRIPDHLSWVNPLEIAAINQAGTITIIHGDDSEPRTVQNRYDIVLRSGYIIKAVELCSDVPYEQEGEAVEAVVQSWFAAAAEPTS